jgi:hypothetical protein
LIWTEKARTVGQFQFLLTSSVRLTYKVSQSNRYTYRAVEAMMKKKKKRKNDANVPAQA